MTNPNVAYVQQGCIWQLLSMGLKAAKLPNYCILHWRLNAQNEVRRQDSVMYGCAKGKSTPTAS